MSAKKGIGVWISGFLTFLAALHTLDAFLSLNSGQTSLLLKIYQINSWLGEVDVSVYFWSSLLSAFALLGVTSVIACHNPKECYPRQACTFPGVPLCGEKQGEKELLKRLQGLAKVIEETHSRIEELKEVVHNTRKPKPSTRKPRLRVADEDARKTSPPECPYYFGYLKSASKNAPIDDVCLGCPKLTECIKGKGS